LVFQVVDSNATVPPRRDARAAGIAVLGSEGLDCNEDGGDFDAYNVPFIPNETAKTWPDYFTQSEGAAMGQYAVAKTGGKGKVIVVADVAGFSKNVEAGQREAILSCKACSVVDTVHYTASQMSDGTLLAKFKAALAAHPEANAVVYPYDTVVSLGGLSSALVQAGRGDMTVVSEGGYATTMKLIRQGNSGLTAVLSADPGLIGWTAMDALNRYFQGTPAVPEGLGLRMVDHDHGASASGGYLSPMDFRTAFKKAWAEGSETPAG
jgi:ribose transport system substrate-binding protein